MVIRCWRALSGGARVRDHERRTLVACSAGADSSALALCLASATANLVIAHVLHDLRPADEARADLETARALAASLALPFAGASVGCRSKPGNPEAVARRERYAALVALAREHACPFIATAHHADDQLETLLMRLVRGAGPRGLSGIAPTRRLASGVTLLRPMLDITRAEAEAICRDAGVEWAVDATNADRSRLRAALRHNVIPALRAIAPGIASTAGRVASVQRSLARELDRAADELLELASMSAGAPPQAETRADPSLGPSHRPDRGESGVVRLSRRVLAEAAGPVLDVALRGALGRAAGGGDAASSRTLARLAGAVRGRSGERRVFQFAGALVELDADWVTIGGCSP